ncbi:proline dehydrogenase [Synchytrium microbalum]|uniref:Proline dehydrogenase n=1 Tax=Synchytrium microbalum TaxID=1806994 RepID=A0A507C2B1_9FUNG|nr:proline dehydrogenase [Synchytrium microbalum]TPX35650.1 proline dehydrogenase [Synchytrium microbalum]
MRRYRAIPLLPILCRPSTTIHGLHQLPYHRSLTTIANKSQRRRSPFFQLFTTRTKTGILLAGGLLAAVSLAIPTTSPLPLSSTASSPTIERDILSSSRPYSTKSITEILNSLLVFKLCQMHTLVSWTPTLLKWSHALHIDPLVHGFIRNTFFKHFCGGEEMGEVNSTMAKFASLGIGSILDYAIEADSDAPQPTADEARAYASRCAKILKECIDVAASIPGSLIAVKVTALVPPQTLMDWSTALNSVHAAIQSTKDTITRDDILTGVQSVGATRDEAIKIYNSLNNQHAVDNVSLSQVFSVWHPEGRKLLSRIAKSDLEMFDDILMDLKGVCLYARERNVRVLIDAEQTYFQPAIDDVANGLAERINPPADANRGPVVFNTYQLYLKDALPRLKRDVERSMRSNYSFAIKMVRGAYMNSERRRAHENSYPDPINPSADATHTQYDTALSYLISHISRHPTSVSLVVASHNRDSIRHAISLMDEYGVDRRSGGVCFAQLMGMQDGVSSGLAVGGFASFKYIPWGKSIDAIPYLLRRAQENSALLGGVAEDVRNLEEELWRRVSEVALEARGRVAEAALVDGI